jgi:hypothetical protein
MLLCHLLLLLLLAKKDCCCLLLPSLMLMSRAGACPSDHRELRVQGTVPDQHCGEQLLGNWCSSMHRDACALCDAGVQLWGRCAHGGVFTCSHACAVAPATQLHSAAEANNTLCLIDAETCTYAPPRPTWTHPLLHTRLPQVRMSLQTGEGHRQVAILVRDPLKHLLRGSSVGAPLGAQLAQERMLQARHRQLPLRQKLGGVDHGKPQLGG